VVRLFGTLVTVLNALEIDPGRTWKGQWRFFGEELLVCCKAIELAAPKGCRSARLPAWPRATAPR
jgi:glutathione gamma-glutamylcysteinyltransferase